MAVGPERFALVVSPGGEVLCHDEPTPEPLRADPLGRIPAVADLLHRGTLAPADSVVELPVAGPVRLTARPLLAPSAHERWVLLTGEPAGGDGRAGSPPPAGGEVPAGELERARALVEQAEEALRQREAELERLRRLSERLLEHAPVAAVLDDRCRIRGWSRRAEQLWAVTPERAAGRPAGSLLEGLDHDSLHERQRIPVAEGEVEVVVEPVGDDEGHLLVRFA
jgi:PAS domain-containing protein